MAGRREAALGHHTPHLPCAERRAGCGSGQAQGMPRRDTQPWGACSPGWPDSQTLIPRAGVTEVSGRQSQKPPAWPGDSGKEPLS